jgi:hypothetical protein
MKWNGMSINNGKEWDEYSLQFLPILGGINILCIPFLSTQFPPPKRALRQMNYFKV